MSRCVVEDLAGLMMAEAAKACRQQDHLLMGRVSCARDLEALPSRQRHWAKCCHYVEAPCSPGPGERRRPGVRLGDDAASWTMHVRVDEITRVRFFREPYPFQPHFPGQEVLGVRFRGPGEDTVLHCYVGDLYDGERMRPEKLEAWRTVRERYGNRDESRVDQGTLLASAA